MQMCTADHKGNIANLSMADVIGLYAMKNRKVTNGKYGR